MGGLGSGTVDAPMTPNRATRIRFDVAQPSVVEQPFVSNRDGRVIEASYLAMAGVNEGWSQAEAISKFDTKNVQRYSNGAWGLSCAFVNPAMLSRNTIGQSGILGDADLDVASGFRFMERWKKPDLTGIGYTSDVASNGDGVFQKSVASGASWNSSLSSDQTAFPPPDGDGVSAGQDPGVPSDRVAVGKTTHEQNQSYVFTFDVPGTNASEFEVLTVFYFGGPLNEYGQGQYALKFRGGGWISLYERVSQTAHGEQQWVVRGNPWRFAPAGMVAGRTHRTRILCVPSGAGGGYILTDHSSTSSASSPGSSLMVASRFLDAGAETSVHIVSIAPAPAGATRDGVTGPGIVRCDMPRDSRGRVQIAKNQYVTSGLLVDATIGLLRPATKRVNLELYWRAEMPTGSIVGRIYDRETMQELTEVSRTDYSAVYTPTYDHQKYFCTFEFTGTGTTVYPLLYGYTLQHNGYVDESAPGEFSWGPGARMKSWSITPAEHDPSTESARVRIPDLYDDLSLLRTRGQFPIVIETQYDGADTSKYCKLMRGYTERIDAHRTYGRGGRTYPDPKAGDLDITGVGEWLRLQEQISTFEVSYVDNDFVDGAGNKQLAGYKVTDIIRTVFGYCGYPSTMIDIPDLEQRFWPPMSATPSDWGRISVGTNWGDWLKNTVRTYFNGWIYFDANAGTYGKWKLGRMTVAPYTSLATFTTESAGSGKLQHVLTAYPANTAPILAPTLQPYVQRPEANTVIVMGATTEAQSPRRITAIMHNSRSFNCYTDSSGVTVETADTAHPDYLGRMVPIVHSDISLMTPDAVKYTCRRLYDVTCYATKRMEFDAPLLLIDHSESGKKRMLHFYDPVTVNDYGTESTWLVRSCVAFSEKDSMQMMHVELESPRF